MNVPRPTPVAQTVVTGALAENIVNVKEMRTNRRINVSGTSCTPYHVSACCRA
jgi:hypothetical protein